MSAVDLKRGDGFIYMKVGVHARETLADILKRKRQEIADAGVSFWGYGGSTCHPLNAVQPFAEEVTASGGEILLLMQEIDSRHFAIPERAKEYSIDGSDWKPVDPNIHVLGSRYALVIDSLEEIDMGVSLENTTVGIGRLAGIAGSAYIRGHVDKACLRYVPPAATNPEHKVLRLRLAAHMAAPYAVLLK